MCRLTKSSHLRAPGERQIGVNDARQAETVRLTKLLEDFVVQVGGKIEADFGLQDKTCWRLLKGQGEGAAATLMMRCWRNILRLIRCALTKLGTGQMAQCILRRRQKRSLIFSRIMKSAGTWNKGVLA